MTSRLLAASLALAVALIATSDASGEDRLPLLGYDWELVESESAFGGRYAHRGAVMGDRMFISGGFEEVKRFLGDVWSSEDGSNWRREVEKAPWSARFAHGIAALDDTLYLMGGYDGEILNDVWKSRDGARWELVTDAAPWSPRSDFQVLSHEGALYLMGGRGRAVRHADVWRTTDGLKWELLTANAWPARSHFGAVSHKGNIVVMGGGYFDFEEADHFYHRDTWSSPDGREWTLMNSNGPQRRRVLMEMVSVGDYIYAIGGDDKPQIPSLRRDAWVTHDGTEWMKLRRMGDYGVDKRLEYETRINHVLLAKDEAIFIIGGHHNFFGASLTVDRYGEWRTDNVWKSTGAPPPEFIPEYPPDDGLD